MIKHFLDKISKIEIELIRSKKIGDTILNVAIFGEEIPQDLYEYKKIFFKKLDDKNSKIRNLKKEIEDADASEKKLLLHELHILDEKITFLKKTYDIEASKLDSQYTYEEMDIDYDYYNNLFFGVTKQDIFTVKKVQETKHIGDAFSFSKQQLKELIKYSNSISPKVDFSFGNYISYAHSNGTLQIIDQESYNLQNIISIFFHEMTHFFRYYNGIQNLGFLYSFEKYIEIEEGIAIYNEYKYGNQITRYGNFIPYYNLCYQVLSKDISEDEKKEQIFQILKGKGYDKKKTNNYYDRFYRYAKKGKTNFFLKDLVYYTGYLKVKNLLKIPSNYEKIMSGKISTYEMEKNLIQNANNFDTQGYFDKMSQKIQQYIH